MESFTKKISLFLVFTLIFSLTFLSGCKKEEGSEFYDKPNVYGNTAGNIQNHGMATMQGDWIFFIGSLGSLYRMKQDGSEFTEIHEYAGFGLNVVGEWIYFIGWEDDKLYRMKLDGSDVSLVIDEECGFVTVHEDWIYYVNVGLDGCIYKVKTDGSGKKKLNAAYSEYISVLGDWIYYVNVDRDETIYRVSTEGVNNEKLRDDEEIESLQIAYDGWLYFSMVVPSSASNVEDSYGIFKLAPDNNERSKVIMSFDNNEHLNVTGDWIYYANSNDGGAVYKIKTDGSGVRDEMKYKLNQVQSGYMNVVGNWIIYREEEWGMIFMMKTDGSENTFIP
ncbi:MAG: DUF5050 domain-containing protein [Oscillospiraceae bacterium]|nr:DUF5050 domain-containing protein [Oscillospiraceae bacterium]